MSDPTTAREVFLAALREKREKLDQLIAQIEAFDLGDGPAAAGAGGPAIGRHDFVGMTTPEAIKKFLRKKRGLHGPRAIAQGLVDGGQGEDVDAVYVNVYSALKRMNNREIVKHKAEWGLAEEFPNLVRKGAAAKADEDDTETDTPLSA